VARPWPGGEKRRGGQASHHEACKAMRPLLLPCAATGVSLLAVWCLSGATPRGQPWTPAVTLPQGCDGLRARWMTVLWTFRELSRCRHARRAFMRHAWLDFTPIIPATACHQRNNVETYSRFMGKCMHHSISDRESIAGSTAGESCQCAWCDGVGRSVTQCWAMPLACGPCTTSSAPCRSVPQATLCGERCLFHPKECIFSHRASS
jgi:hypothetical protein